MIIPLLIMNCCQDSTKLDSRICKLPDWGEINGDIWPQRLLRNLLSFPQNSDTICGYQTDEAAIVTPYIK